MFDGTATWTNTYNSDGLRTSRTNGTTTYNYYYEGSQLTEVTGSNGNVWIFYDGNRPVIIKYGDTATYHYELNLQGDVIAILASDGTRVVEYTYDAWGNILSITGSEKDTLGQANPLRYRGYVYDPETGMYYCQSRYYDPQTRRFLNSDIVYDTDAGLQGYNLFIYCGNNPISRIDASGTDSIDMIDGDKEDEPELEGGAPGNGMPNVGAPSYPVPGYNYAGNSGHTEVHHIVEQCQANKSGFSTQQIQSSGNKVTLDYDLHRQISGYYSSKPDWANGLRVRDYLAGQSFEVQTAYGWSIINLYYRRIYG